MATRQPLATPSDLPAEAVDKVTAALNPLIADSFALYIKTKNFHWHVSGPRFRDLHLLFDEQADQIFASIDPLAERVRKLGRLTLHSIREVADLASITDDDEGFVGAIDMVTRLLDDNRAVVEKMRAALAVVSEANDGASENLLQALIDEAERRVWFLFEASQSE
jgi:starvation-inducible DNA-binding protein